MGEHVNEADEEMSDVTASTAADNGHAPASAEEVLDRLRVVDDQRAIFGGFGPLVVGVVLLVVMMFLAPSVAPEIIIERPVGHSESGEVEP